MLWHAIDELVQSNHCRSPSRYYTVVDIAFRIDRDVDIFDDELQLFLSDPIHTVAGSKPCSCTRIPVGQLLPSQA